MDNVELVTELRHELHAHPELSNHEVWTRRRLIDFLHAHTRNLEIVDEGKGYFYARYICHGSSETVAVRADFDALPIDEGIRMPWSSRNPGVSHKCGHDGHSASLAGLALEVDQKGADKNVVFIFQDAEEVGDGARVACEVIERERVDEVYAFHNWSRMEARTVNVIDGPTMPASRGLAIAFHGKTSHAAEPENGINPAFAIAKVVDAVPGLTRPEDHKGYVMCTIVQVDVGSANFGVNAGEGRLLMTLRAQYEEEIDELQAALESLAREHAAEAGMTVDFELSDVFPATINAKRCADAVRAAAEASGVAWHTLPDPSPVRASEDFGYYQQKAPGCMFYIGNGFDYPDVHTTPYDFPDANIAVAMKVFSRLVGVKQEREGASAAAVEEMAPSVTSIRR
ncbi:M20 metallopeptidase family protein [Slackia exigua]